METVKNKLIQGTGEHLEIKSEGKHMEIDFEDDCSTSSEELLGPLSTFISLKSYEHTCEICQKTFTMSSSLKNHMHTHRPENISKRKKIFSCDMCGKEFMKQSTLDSHERLHTGERPYKCQFCSEAFRSSALLTYHNRIHTGKAFTCEICKKIFIHSTHYTNHLRIHTGEKPYKCDICKKLFAQISALNRHLLIHSSKSRYTCNLCSDKFQTQSEVKIHLQTCHIKGHMKTHLDKEKIVKVYHNKKKRKPESSEGGTLDRVLVKSEREQGGEVKTKIKTEMLALEQVQEVFPFEVPVTYDVGLIKQEPPDTSTKDDPVFILPDNPSKKELGSKTYYCNFCKQQYINEHMFTKHMKIHLDEGFTCDKCGERFPYKIQLRIHMRKHAGRETYPCRICHKLYLSKSHLDAHFRKHTGEKPFPCGICNAMFVARGSLNIHMASHDRQGKAVPSLTPGNALSYE